MGLKLLLLLSIALILAVQWGRRRNLALAAAFLRVVDESFPVTRKDSVVLGHGLGYGIDYELDGDFPSLKVVLTLLPRYAPLYLPIAHILGRRDLLKLTFTGGPIATGVGAILHDCGDSRLPFDREEGMRDDRIDLGNERYRVYAFNPYVTEMLRGVLPALAGVSGFRYLSVDSRTGSLSVYLVPRVETLAADLVGIGTAIRSICTN